MQVNWLDSLCVSVCNISSALCGRYEISRDPERWLDINRDTGDITAKRTFNMRSPNVKNNIYKAVVKVTGQLTYQLEIYTLPGLQGLYLL